MIFLILLNNKNITFNGLHEIKFYYLNIFIFIFFNNVEKTTFLYVVLLFLIIPRIYVIIFLNDYLIKMDEIILSL